MKKVITFLLLCLASTAMLAQQVSVDYKHNANFSQHHTYVWGSNNRSAVQNSILAQVAALPANRDNRPAVYAGPLVSEPSASGPGSLLSRLSPATQLAKQPGSSKIPFPMHCAYGGMKNLRGLFSCKPSKETQFDKLPPSIIDPGQFDQSLIESQYIRAALGRLIRLSE